LCGFPLSFHPEQEGRSPRRREENRENVSGNRTPDFWKGEETPLNPLLKTLIIPVSVEESRDPRTRTEPPPVIKDGVSQLEDEGEERDKCDAGLCPV